MTEHATALARDGWALIGTDWRDPAAGLANLPDRSIDVTISDPPYSEHVHKKSRRGLTNYKERKGAAAREARVRDLGFDHLTAKEWADFAAQVARVTKRWALIFCDEEGVEGWRQDIKAAGMEYVRTGIWVKSGCAPQMTGDRPANGHECIVIAHQTGAKGRPIKKRWNGGGKRAVWTYPIVLSRGRDNQRVHTTQKPLGLMSELVELFSDEGEIVMDAYAGAGTTGVACRMAGRRFLGWERDPEVYPMANRRIAGKRAVLDEHQMELFG